MTPPSSLIQSFVLFICRLALGLVLASSGYVALFGYEDPVSKEVPISEQADLSGQIDKETINYEIKILNSLINPVISKYIHTGSDLKSARLSNILSWAILIESFLIGIFLIIGMCTRACALLIAISSLFLIFCLGVPKEFGISAQYINLLILTFSISLILIFQGGGLLSLDRIIFSSNKKEKEL